MKLDKKEIRRMIFTYCKGLFSMIFVLSALSLLKENNEAGK
jgi:hypothetical protein